MKRLIYTTILVVVFTMGAIAQSDDAGKGRFWDKIALGGNLGLQFGKVTFIDISPTITYRVTDNFQVGTGFIYQFIRFRDYYYAGQDYKTYIVGGKVFTRYFIWQDLFLHAEYQLLNLEGWDIGIGYHRTNVNIGLVGGGYRQAIGTNSFLYISILYDFIGDPNSPYINPITQVGFSIGL